MSMNYEFISVTNELLTQLLNEECHIDSLDSTKEGYENVKNASFYPYSRQLMELLLDNKKHSLSPLLNLGDVSTPLTMLYEGGALYNADDVSEVVKAFEKTDLDELATQLGFPESEDKDVENSLYKSLNEVKELFLLAKENNLSIISYME